MRRSQFPEHKHHQEGTRKHDIGKGNRGVSDGIEKESLNGGSSARLSGRVDFLEAWRRNHLYAHHFRNCFLATRTCALLVDGGVARGGTPQQQKVAQ